MPLARVNFPLETWIYALLETKDLFLRLAKMTAEMNDYNYPEGAESYVESLLLEYFDGRSEMVSV